MKRSIIFVLVGLLIVATLAPAACAEQYGFETNIIGDGSQTLSLMTYQNWDSAAYYDSEEGLLIENTIQDITGVNIEWECISSDDYDTVAQTRLAAGMNLADIMRVPTTSGSVSKYADEGLFINLSPYINEQNTPNIVKLFEKYPFVKAVATSPDGNIYALPYTEVGTNDIMVYWTSIRKDWLDNLGLEMPTTIDEYHDVLLAFKQQDANGNGDPNDEVPLGYLGNSMFGLYSLKGAFGMQYGSDMWSINDDGKVQLDLTDPRFKECLTALNQWYSEGLLFTEVGNSGWTDVCSQDRLGGQTNISMDNLLTYNGFCYDVNPNCNYVYIPLISNPKYPDNEPKLSKRSNGYWGYYAVTADCKDPELAMKWIDWVWASDESQVLRYYGIEGVTFETVDGVKTYFDSITKTPNGAIGEMRALGGWPNFLANESGESFMAMFVSQYPEQANKEFSQYFVDQMPILIGADEENKTYTTLWPDIETYLKETVVSFIIGTKPIEEFDAFVTTLNDMGLDKVTAIRQAWYDRAQQIG